MEEKWIVIVGNLALGIQTAHGSFENKDLAAQWANEHVGDQEYLLMPVSPAS